MEQLDLFSLETDDIPEVVPVESLETAEDSPEYTEGDMIKVVGVEELESPVVETEHYIKLHQGKKGMVKEVHCGKFATSYRVDTGKEMLWLYAHEMIG